MKTFEEQMRQAEKVLNVTSDLFAHFENPAVAASTAMTLLDIFIEFHPDQEEETIEALKICIEGRDRVIELSGKMFENAEGMN